jgi:protein tyrosine phosphatase (PTP) superfamily phosphohydrolase (DUF442 family)
MNSSAYLSEGYRKRFKQIHLTIPFAARLKGAEIAAEGCYDARSNARIFPDPNMADAALATIYNYRAVDETLATSGQPTVPQLGAMATAGFRVVVNLALHDDPRYSLPDEAGTVRSLGMTYVHIPVQFAAPTEANLLDFFAAMDAHQGENTWVHCAANMRVSAFLGLYRVIRQGWEQDRAFALMRDLWQPNAVWSSFIAEMLAKHRR